MGTISGFEAIDRDKLPGRGGRSDGGAKKIFVVVEMDHPDESFHGAKIMNKRKIVRTVSVARTP